ncbi:hypothetical protein BC827DRAFT_1274258 [Russula dissimulans]|nr:hypothetical protein BC827DRAFT_1274258 [Russula dissimulans]
MRPSLGITDGLPVLVMSAVIKPESNLDRPSSLFSSPVMLDIARTELEKVVSASAYAAPLTPVAHPPSRCFRHSSGTLRGEILVLWRPDFRLVANTIVRQRNSVTLQQWAVFGIIIAKWFWDVGTPPLIRSPGDLISMAIWQWALLALETTGLSLPVVLSNQRERSINQRIIEGQDLWPSGASAVPYVNQNQGLGNATRIVATMADQAYVPFVSQQSQMNRGTLVTRLHKRHMGLFKPRPVQDLIKLKSLT